MSSMSLSGVRKSSGNATKHKKKRWTKPPKFDGQATFDVYRDMAPVQVQRTGCRKDGLLLDITEIIRVAPSIWLATMSQLSGDPVLCGLLEPSEVESPSYADFRQMLASESAFGDMEQRTKLKDDTDSHHFLDEWARIRERVSALESIQSRMSTLAFFKNLWWWQFYMAELIIILVKRYKMGSIPSETLDAMKSHIKDAKELITWLQDAAPELQPFWISFQRYLDHYTDVLAELKAGRTDWKIPWMSAEDWKLQELPQYDVQTSHSIKENTFESQWETFEQAIFGSDEDENHESHSEPSLNDDTPIQSQNDRNTIAKLAMKGWTICGQGIAQSFDEFYDIIKVLYWTSVPEIFRRCVQPLIKVFSWVKTNGDSTLYCDAERIYNNLRGGL